MGDALNKRIKQAKFQSPAQEAMINLLVAADYLRERMDKICAEFGVTHQQYNVLRILRGVHPNGHSRCEVSARMIDRAPDVTRLVDRLEAQGLVERGRSGEDRRQSIARITAKGLALLERMEPATRALQREFGAKIPTEDCRLLSRICEEIYADDL